MELCRLRAAILAAAILSLAAGCGGKKLKTAEVEGVVTLNGNPLPDAVVIFTPTERDGLDAPASSGRTDGSGRYTLAVTVSGQAGAVLGKHRVICVRNPAETQGADADVAPLDEDPLPPHEVVIEVKEGELNDGSFDIKGT